MRRASMMGLGLTGALRGDRTPTLLVPSLRLSLGAVLAINALRMLAHGVGMVMVQLLRRPLSTLAVCTVGTAWVLAGPVHLALAAAVLAAALAVWRWRWPSSFTRFAGDPSSSR